MDQATGQRLLTPEEDRVARENAEQRAVEEARARQEAEKKAAEEAHARKVLEEKIERLERELQRRSQKI